MLEPLFYIHAPALHNMTTGVGSELHIGTNPILFKHLFVDGKMKYLLFYNFIIHNNLDSIANKV